MNYVTRFNPTTNGDLHLGHVYAMLFNEYMGHSNGGKFFVRFEDNQIDSLYSVNAVESGFYCERQREAIEWLGIPVDVYFRQSTLDLDLKQFVANHGWFIPEYRWPYEYALDPTKGGEYLGHPGGYKGEWFPYAPYITYCKVIYDELAGVNVLIRGDDLRSEFSLYQHYRNTFGLKEINHYYLPRIDDHKEKVISKWYKAKSILEYKDAGWTAERILDGLARSALKKPGDGWKLANVKRFPRLVEEFST